MASIRIKPEFLGASTTTKTLGRITIAERHVDILTREGRYDLLDGIVSPTKLVALKDKKVAELKEIAEGLEGYSSSLTKAELIDLIRATPSA